MVNWDLTIFDSSTKTNIVNQFRLTEQVMETAGQHGHSIVLKDIYEGEWLLKIFPNIIDFELKEIQDLEVDIEESPEINQDRMHLWRILNELTASRLAQRLHLNVPKVIIITSQVISDFNLSPQTSLSLGDVVIFDDEGAPETTDEYYQYSERDPYSLETSIRFEEILSKKSNDKTSSSPIALLIQKIPNSVNLDQYFDSVAKGIDEAFEEIQSLDDGYYLLPFDLWLNDPDRNVGNYLVTLNDQKKAIKIWGIDYEMWALGSDIWMEEDEITKGRSYLTAIIHNNTNIFDPRINHTVFRIRNLSDEEIHWMARAPQLLCKYFEYHISRGTLLPDERIRLKQVEINLEDFLTESRPRSDKLSNLLIKQIGMPKDFS